MAPQHQAKDYRAPRRRPAHLRTKTGCLTCRRRKKKCDETPGTCSNCARRWLSCEWPGFIHSSRQPQNIEVPKPDETPPPGISPQSSGDEWQSTQYNYTGDSAANAYSLCDNAQNSDLQPSPSNCTSSSSYSGHTITTHGTQLFLGHTPPTMYFPSDITSASTPLFEFLRTVFLRQLIRPMAHDAVIESAAQESLMLAFRTPFYMHSLLACCGAEIPVQDLHAQVYFQKLGRVHYVKAIVGLRESLDNGRLDVNNTAIIRTSLMLCIYERSKPRLSKGVDAHLLGLAQLVQLRFRRNNSSPELQTETEAAITRVILEGFIFHATTSIPFQQTTKQPETVEMALSLAEDKLQDMFKWKLPLYPDSPVLGAPPKLFSYAREIALMHERSSEAGVDIRRCYELQVLLDWLIESEAFCLEGPSYNGSLGVLVGETNMPYMSPLVTFETPLLFGPRLYIVVSKILLQRMISTTLGTVDHSLTELVCEGVSLVSQLDPSRDYYAEYYCWPMIVLGTCRLTSNTQRDCLLSQALAFWKATRNGTMKRLMDMLTVI
ncbi:hypothetical protein BBP40_000468 [Aspergillus hancockii]|nr:hypothetical protein BBP40_000468 [Aspergillus hancockii]